MRATGVLRSRLLVSAFLVSIAAVVAAPEGAAAAVAISPANATYVGRVAGTDAFVALVSDGREVRAYVCDGKGVSTWFSGPMAGKAFAAANEGLSIAAAFGSASSNGSVVLPDGKLRSFTASKAPAGGPAGLYRGELTQGGKTYVGGWIVLSNRLVRGFVEQDNLAVPFQPTSTNGIIAILIGRRAVDLAGVGSLQITDGTSNTRL